MQRGEFLCVIISFVFILTSCEKEYSCEKCIATQPVPAKNVVFYALNGCVNNRPITLIVDGTQYLLVNISFSVPNCSTPGTAQIALTPGIHSWQASCELVGPIAGGIIDVLPGACQVQEIK